MHRQVCKRRWEIGRKMEEKEEKRKKIAEMRFERIVIKGLASFQGQRGSPRVRSIESYRGVSYTHLDVYKRQRFAREAKWLQVPDVMRNPKPRCTCPKVKTPAPASPVEVKPQEKIPEKPIQKDEKKLIAPRIISAA
ncbi:hypothetical protein DBV15_08528 [Temnothorax longispinosus]|uniref:Uncharacterized protein n=1 Tax=Temnothorax longispinosus TaxID=300112 RepID=A0A4S2KTI9_9HYME|nr:hypothetical protein DBV15_08528 [Temnothorax longispinosus]